MGAYDEDELCRSEFGLWADELSAEERAGLLIAYTRRKQWEAKVQAMAQLELQTMLFSQPPPGEVGPAVTADGERIQRTSTRAGLSALLQRQRGR
jgi:hypothetical protein